MADTHAVANDMGLTIPPGAKIDHAELIAGRDDAARLIMVLPTSDWQGWQAQLAGRDAPTASPDANFHLGPDEGGWTPGTASGLSTVQLPWRGETEALNIGTAPAGPGQVRVFVFWHRR